MRKEFVLISLLGTAVLFTGIQFSIIKIMKNDFPDPPNEEEIFESFVTGQLKDANTRLERMNEALSSKKQEISQPVDMLLSSNNDKSSDTESVKRNLPQASTLPVLVFAYNRPKELKHFIDRISPIIETKGNPLFLSQDGGHVGVNDVIEEFEYNRKHHLKHPRPEKISAPRGQEGYYYIAQHYGWAIRKVFEANASYKAIIILEEDIEVSSDFFDYFEHTFHILEMDDSVLCVSAYNDFGQKGLVSDPSAIRRSDFFPGLGWILTRKLWEAELDSKWPESFWDDWLRLPAQMKGRSCLYPEISRTKTFGKSGTSGGQFFDKYLGTIHLNDDTVDYSKIDLSFLKKEEYDAKMDLELKKAKSMSFADFKRYVEDNNTNSEAVIKVSYAISKWNEIADYFGIIAELKLGLPRTVYRRCVILHYRDLKLYICAT